MDSIVLFIIACLFISITSASIDYDLLVVDNDNDSPFGSQWQFSNTGVFKGFCFNYSDPQANHQQMFNSITMQSSVYNSYRTINNYSNPLYSHPIILGYIQSNQATIVAHWIVKIILQEVLGYLVKIDDSMDYYTDFTKAFIRSPINQKYPIDMLVSTGFASLSDTFKPKFEKNVELDNLINNGGVHDSFEKTGIFITGHSVINNAEHQLLAWEAWSGGINTPLTMQIPGNANLQAVVDLFRNDSWSLIQDKN